MAQTKLIELSLNNNQSAMLCSYSYVCSLVKACPIEFIMVGLYRRGSVNQCDLFSNIFQEFRHWDWGDRKPCPIESIQ